MCDTDLIICRSVLALLASVCCHLQDYRARKRQRLQKKLAEQLRAHNKGGQWAGSIGLGSDLQQVINSFLERAPQHAKGSRFQHAERLQFAKVWYRECKNEGMRWDRCVKHFCVVQEDEAPAAVEAATEEVRPYESDVGSAESIADALLRSCSNRGKRSLILWGSS